MSRNGVHAAIRLAYRHQRPVMLIASRSQIECTELGGGYVEGWSTETFTQGTGDALLTYENEAIFDERNGEPVEHVTPDTTFKIENPVAVLNTSKHKAQAEAFVKFLYTEAGQRAWAQAGFRPVNPQVAREFAKDFPTPKKLYTIDDLGGWAKVNDQLFDPDKGAVAKIYNAATH